MDNEEWDMKLVTSSLYSRLFSRSPAISCSVKVAEQTKAPLENWFRVQAPPILFSGSFLSTWNLKPETRNQKLEIWNGASRNQDCVTQDDDTWNMKLLAYIAGFSTWLPAISCGVEVAEQTKAPLENWFRVQAPPVLLSGCLLYTSPSPRD